jgi:O-antigen/teichoic acid export membrane protein
MTNRLRLDAVGGPAAVLVAGRTVGFVAVFAIPIVLARLFNPAEFGTYKQLFLLFATLYGVAQFGVAESLYYFIPRQKSEAGRHVCNALVTLALAGLACLALLYAMRRQIAAWLTNSQLADQLGLLGILLALTLISAVFEIVMISRGQHGKAAVTYASSDLARALLFIVPALGFGGVRGVLIGAVAFGALRVAAMLAYLWHEFGRDLRIDTTLWRSQLAYALPFALAVGIEVVQINFHQYFVAAHFDAATFAIYAVGCLQIPLVDLVMTSTVNVMMVQMAEHARGGQRRAAMALWHATVARLALILVPLAVFLLVAARPVVVALFTTTYLASVPIFVVWTLTILPAVLAVDGVLRVYAQTRFLLLMNVLRFAFVVALIGPFLAAFGLIGAVLVTLLATTLVKGLAVVKITRLLGAPLHGAMPWARLAVVAGSAAVAALPALWVVRTLALPPFVLLACAGTAYLAVYAVLVQVSGTLRESVPAIALRGRETPDISDPPTTPGPQDPGYVLIQGS